MDSDHNQKRSTVDSQHVNYGEFNSLYTDGQGTHKGRQSRDIKWTERGIPLNKLDPE